MRKDVQHSEAIYNNWKEKVSTRNIKGISKRNSDLIIKYVFDMETGQNIARRSKRGGRSFGRLVVIKNLIIKIVKLLEKRGIKDITEITESQAHLFFHDIYTGKIRRDDDEKYKFGVQFVSIFKAFWHWWMKVNRKKGKMLIDICEDLELRTPVISFVYITKEQIDKMLPYFDENEQVLCLFLFDTIIRFPTECLSLQVKDIYERDGEIWINIPDDASKTFGRTFNLLYCGDEIMKYIKRKELKQEDFLFQMNGNNVGDFNKKLKKVAVQVLSDKVSHPKAQGKFSEISGYDFRHSGTIHLRILAQKNNSISLDAIRQRGGWSSFDMLNYYTQMIGLSGEIKKESLLIQEDRTKLEKDIVKLKKDNENIKVGMMQFQKLFSNMAIVNKEKQLLEPTPSGLQVVKLESN